MWMGMKAHVMQKESMSAFDMMLRNKSGDRGGEEKMQQQGKARHFEQLIYHELKTRDFINITTFNFCHTHTMTTTFIVNSNVQHDRQYQQDTREKAP